MKNRAVKILVMSSGGVVLGFLLGYLGQCAGST
jgi:hypothetical protein